MPSVLAFPLLGAIASLLASFRVRVDGDSMRPTLQDGQHVLARRIGPSDATLRRGDVVVLRHPHRQRVILIKRVIGLPGEHLRRAEDAVYVNDVPLAELYLDGPPCPEGRYARQWVLEPGEYFVLGDNRRDSHDSRAFGPIARDLVLGWVWRRCWPPGAWGRVSRDESVSERSPG